MGLKEFIKSRIYFFLRKDNYKNYSYSQEGEDILLSKFFENKKEPGFFVDVGAHHPKKFSNTYLFYLKGWRGINIDAMPDSMIEFNKIRPDDINIECGVSNEEGELDYYVFNEPLMNTFSKKDAEIVQAKKYSESHELVKVIKVNTKPLSKILDECLLDNVNIDFLSVDVEGFDLKVLQSNNWTKYKPKLILIESLRSDLNVVSELEISKYLSEKGYLPYSKLFNTLLYKLK